MSTARHAKPSPPGKTRALVLGLINGLSAALFIANGYTLGFVFVIVASLYLLSWKFDFND